MTVSSDIPASASASIPYWCRLILLYIEPVFATNGALLCLFNPLKYLISMTRHSATTMDPSTKFIYTELAGSWFHFAFTEAVILRLVDDVRVWRLLSVGMILSDVWYAHSCAEAVGGWAQWLKIWEWTLEDWFISLGTWPMLAARVVIALKIGWEEKAKVEA